MGEIDAAAELVTGGLLGRAVEPNHGAGKGGGHGLICLNCGTALIGPHCYECGQSGHVHRSLAAIGHDLLHGVAHFEGKFWKTLPMLAWRPGDLTRRYIAGERARFVSPMAIFLFSIFAMFAVFQILGISTPAEFNAEPVAAIETAQKRAVEKRENLIQRRASLASDEEDKRIRLNGRIAQLDEDIAGYKTASRTLGGEDLKVTTPLSDWHALDHGIEKWKKNPALMLYKLQSSVYKFSWLLIPLSLPFMWLLFFWKRQYKLYDHTIFVTYSLAFVSILFIVLTLLGAVGVTAGWLVMLGLVIPPIHLARQMQQAYQLRWFPAILRTVVLSWFIMIIVVLFIALLLVMGLLG